MSEQNTRVYPYIPNSVPAVKQAMLDAVGAESVEDFFADIPQELRLKNPMKMPDPLLDEYSLQRHVEGLLQKNKPCGELLSFIGAGCYQHHVPAVCDEINQRGELLSAYAGEPYDDHARFQLLFEYCSMMGELLNMEVVNVPTYDGFQATATSIRMACRVTGRRRVLLPASVHPDKMAMIETYCRADVDLVKIPFDPQTGRMNIGALAEELSDQVAAIFFENPGYLGAMEEGQTIVDLAHQVGALAIVGVDPSSLGVVAPPADYGADIACGDLQPLGMHMAFGAGHAGFIASHDIPEIVMQYPSRLFGIAPTTVPGEYGFTDVAFERTSFDKREEGNEFVGTHAALWGITAGVYMALMGPKGMQDLGLSIMQRSGYARACLSNMAGVHISAGSDCSIKEFVVNFDDTGKTVAQINAALLKRGIQGGKDLSSEFPQLGQSALYCVTEIHTQQDIDTLITTLAEVL